MKNKPKKTSILLSPAEIREYRNYLRITQEQAATICGGGPNAFSRYESGKAKPSKATCNLLKLLVKHPYEIPKLLGIELTR